MPGLAPEDSLADARAPSTRPSRRRRAILVACVCVVGIALSLALPTYFLSWAPVAHFACVTTSDVETNSFYLPLALVNSPYGGRGSVNSSFNAQSVGLPPTWPLDLVGGGTYNGSVWGAFELETAHVSTLENETVLGPGSSVRCSQALSVHLQTIGPNGGQGVAGEIFNTPWGPEFGTGESSDAGEPLEFNFTPAPGNATSWFHGGFTAANSSPISTCGKPADSVEVRTVGLTTWIPLEHDGMTEHVAVLLPLTESFTYYFPANFGSWQIDSLSASGGPGGGWAFSYSPCAPG